jgi:PAS domain S-box-containing protein
MRAVLASVDVAITVHDRDGRLVWGAEQAARVFDLPRPTMPIDGSGRLVHPEDLPGLTDAVLCGGRARYRLCHPDGRELWIEATCTDCRADPQIRGFLIVHRNVDAEVRAEEASAARELERDAARIAADLAVVHLGQVVEAMDEGLVELDETGAIRLVNRRIGEMTGCEPGDLIGESWLALVHPAERERVYTQNAGKVLVPGDRRTYVARLHTTDGMLRTVQVRANVLEAEAGLRIVVVLSDITELEASREAAVLAERTKSKFVARVAHELRNPLQPIVAIADLLADPDITPDELAEYAALIGHAGRSMVRLVDELVDLERLSLGVMSVEQRPVAVTELCRTIATHYRFAAPDQPITVTGAGCEASADEGRVEQVLVGVLANALRYARTPIEIDVRQSDVRVVIQVADHGPGIPAHLRERAFEPFDRLDRTDREGAGIGLAVTKRLVAAMGGTIELTDTPGGGLTVVIGLPAV